MASHAPPPQQQQRGALQQPNEQQQQQQQYYALHPHHHHHQQQQQQQGARQQQGGGGGGMLGGPSPPHLSAPPHLPVSGSSVSYSDDVGVPSSSSSGPSSSSSSSGSSSGSSGGASSSFGMLSMPFDDSSSHLDLPSLLQAHADARDMRSSGGGPSHDAQQHAHLVHASSSGSPLHHASLHHASLHASQAPLHHHHHHHHDMAMPSSSSANTNLWNADLSREGGENRPLGEGSAAESALATTGAKRSMADAFILHHHGAATQPQTYLAGAEDAPKPPRTKKKKTSEKNAASSTRDEANEAFDDDFGDGFDADLGDVGASKDIKRQMRLVKNRQAAQQFRKRQKQYIQDLEKRCSALAAQNASFGAKVELLTTENRLVKEQLEYLRSFVSQAVQVSLTPAAVAGGPLQMPAPLSAALAGAIPASLLGIGSPLAGALSSSLPSQTGPGRPSFAPLQPSPSASLGGKLPSSFSSPLPVSSPTAAASASQRSLGGPSYPSMHQPSAYPSASASHPGASYVRPHHAAVELGHRML